jgi:8-oxo-dGTP pyrophosphatase MutT (NUDIX family)
MAVVPQPASTVILVRDAVAGPPTRLEVFMVRRHHGASFMAGAYVFPGGRVDPGDRLAAAEDRCDGAAHAAATFPDLSSREAVGFFVAAVRELFEEAGVLLARSGSEHLVGGTDETIAPWFATEREAAYRGERSVVAIAEARALRLALDRLVPVAHWVTPSVEPRRFDTRFFVTALPAEQAPTHDPIESTDSFWVQPGEALDRFARGEIVLAPPTWHTLHDLEGLGSAAEALEWARTQPIVRVEPQFVERAGVAMLVMPGDPLFEGTVTRRFEVASRFVLDRGRWCPRSAE